MSLLANAYGNFLSNALPFYQTMPGIVTPHGTLVKPGGRIAAYVRSTGAQDGEDHFAASGMLVTTLNAGLARCRSGYGDIVYMLPGHTESINAADFASSLVAGTQIVSAGTPGMSNNPKLTWNTTANATFLLDVADCSIVGMTLDWAGVADVTAPITVTGAGCAIVGCKIVAQSDTVSFQCKKGVTVSTGANDFLFYGNTVLCDSEDDDANVTGGIINIAAAVNNTRILGNMIGFSCTGDSVGIIDQTATAVNTQVIGNYLWQFAANAAFCIIMDNGTGGIVARNYCRIVENVAPTSAGVSIAAGTFLLHDNQCSAANAATTATHNADS